MRAPDRDPSATADSTSSRGLATSRVAALVVAATLVCTGGATLVGQALSANEPAHAQIVVEHTLVSAKRVPPAPRAASPARVEAAEPEQLTIDSVGVDAPVDAYTDQDVVENDGWINPPQPDAVSWWAGGGTPASDATNTVYLYGHVSRRPAVFNSLRDVQPGATVALRTANGTLEYTVTEVLEPIAKDALPTDGRVNAAVPGRLVLIGCYRDADQGTRPTTHNTVVIAQLTAPATT